jgi:hypothetical protein
VDQHSVDCQAPVWLRFCDRFHQGNAKRAGGCTRSLQVTVVAQAVLDDEVAVAGHHLVQLVNETVFDQNS